MGIDEDKAHTIANALREEGLPPSVWEVGVGYKERKGELSDEPCLVFFVHSKYAINQLDKQSAIPSEIEGIPTDVREARLARHALDPYKRTDPLEGGVSMTAEGKGSFSGTLGAIFRNRRTRELTAVTNRHVMRYSVGLVGWFRGQHGNIDAYQPSVQNGNIIGVVVRESKYPDCAAISLNDSRVAPAGTTVRATDVSPQFQIVGIAEAKLGDRVFKVGARTGYTAGKVTVAGMMLEIRPADGDPKTIADHGDSGSVWCRDTAGRVEAIGLHYGGPKSLNQAFAHSMSKVADFLEIEPL